MGRVVYPAALPRGCLFTIKRVSALLYNFLERCESGRIGLPAKELCPERVPGVRIPPAPKTAFIAKTEVVAQLDRAADCGSAGRTFESCQPHKEIVFP